MAKDKFPRDLDRLLNSMKPTTHTWVMEHMVELRDRLVELRKKRLVKINHSVIELICARHLIECGYRVSLEWFLDGGKLIADLYAVRAENAKKNAIPSKRELELNSCPGRTETMLVECETGFVPPRAALAPGQYRQARIAAKIARYSGHSEQFGLATPSYHVLQVPQVLLRPPEMRERKEIQDLKLVVDKYYPTAAIPVDSLETSELDSIYIVNVDKAGITQVEPHRYLDTILRADGLIGQH